jgi:hypothetical protein
MPLLKKTEIAPENIQEVHLRFSMGVKLLIFNLNLLAILAILNGCASLSGS